MRRLAIVLLLCLGVLVAGGCGSEGERGKYKDRDKPRAADKADKDR
jgi:hypothetical protein